MINVKIVAAKAAEVSPAKIYSPEPDSICALMNLSLIRLFSRFTDRVVGIFTDPNIAALLKAESAYSPYSE